MQDTREADFTIFVHVFYPDVWAEIAADLETVVHQPFDLIITRPEGSHPVIHPRTPFLSSVTELVVENRGRDILPFLTALKHQPNFPGRIGLKLHTKRSLHRSDGDGWRRFLTGTLLEVDGNGRLLGHSLIQSEPRIGIVASTAHLLPLGGRTSINKEVMIEALRRIAPSKPPSALDGSRFAAGSMFWFCGSALQSIVETEVTDLFVRESGQLDGTAAHAFERLFAFVAEQNGFVAAGMENAAAILGLDDHTLSRKELVELIDETLVRENPFTLPLASFWRRYPALLKCAHAVYGRMPKSAVRLIRRSIGR